MFKGNKRYWKSQVICWQAICLTIQFLSWWTGTAWTWTKNEYLGIVKAWLTIILELGRLRQAEFKNSIWYLVSFRSIWTTKQIPKQPGFHSETSSQTNINILLCVPLLIKSHIFFTTFKYTCGVWTDIPRITIYSVKLCCSNVHLLHKVTFMTSSYYRRKKLKMSYVFTSKYMMSQPHLELGIHP